jgi:hypothetical protein
MLLRRHKPREALSQLMVPSLASDISAQINRAVVLHDLADGSGGCRKELEAASTASPHSVFAAFNLAQLQLLEGEWCRPLSVLLELHSLSPKLIESDADVVDGTPESERAVIAKQVHGPTPRYAPLDKPCVFV